MMQQFDEWPTPDPMQYFKTRIKIGQFPVGVPPAARQMVGEHIAGSPRIGWGSI
jgi:hypothetical protein